MRARTERAGPGRSGRPAPATPHAPPEKTPNVDQLSTTCCTLPTQAPKVMTAVQTLSTRSQKRVRAGGCLDLMKQLTGASTVTG